MKTAVITGASSGLGVEFARAALHAFPEIEEMWLVARRADKLNALCAEIRTLGDSMELSQYRLSEMLDRLGGELWREYTAALTGEQLGAGEAWAATVQKEADGGSLSGLDKQDIAALITLGEAFSSISRAAQADHACLTLRQMEVRAADAEKALMGKGKLYSTLGVLAGFAAALMMI